MKKLVHVSGSLGWLIEGEGTELPPQQQLGGNSLQQTIALQYHSSPERSFFL